MGKLDNKELSDVRRKDEPANKIEKPTTVFSGASFQHGNSSNEKLDVTQEGEIANNLDMRALPRSMDGKSQKIVDLTGSNEEMNPNIENTPKAVSKIANCSKSCAKLARKVVNSGNEMNANGYDGSISSDVFYDESIRNRAVAPRLDAFQTLTKNFGGELSRNFDVLPSTQEIQTAKEVKPLLKPHFIKARGVVNIEEAPFSKRYLVIFQVVLGLILGIMSRVGMITLTNYQGAYINYHPGTCLWCNFASCFVLGLCNNFFTFWSNALKNSGKRNMKQLALHTGITFGFCGAFSSWGALLCEVDFKTIDIANGGRKLPAKGYGALEFFSVFFVQMSICVTGYVLGKDFAALLDIWSVKKRALRHWNYENLRRVEVTCAILGALGIVANVAIVCTLPMSNWYKRKYAITILFGIPAGLLRFFFSSYNGVLPWKWLPAGTLISNICSSIVMAVLNILILGYKDEKESEMIIRNASDKYILKSLVLGFCGSLSSIASVINELYSLEHPVQRYIYFGATFFFCWIPLFVIDCVYAWVRGFNPN